MRNFVYFDQLSNRSTGASDKAEHNSVLGNWIRQNIDCHHASTPLCLSVEKTITFFCSFFGSHCCLSTTGMCIYLLICLLISSLKHNHENLYILLWCLASWECEKTCRSESGRILGRKRCWFLECCWLEETTRWKPGIKK